MPSLHDDDEELPPPSEPSVGWALGLGFVGGSVGGVAMIFIAAEIARRLRFDPDLVRAIGRAAHLSGEDPLTATIALAVGVGGLTGLALGAALRHAGRLIARVLAGVILAAALWTFVHAFVLKAFAPRLGALPFGPMVAGAVAYGLCVAMLRPPKKRVPHPEG